MPTSETRRERVKYHDVPCCKCSGRGCFDCGHTGRVPMLDKQVRLVVDENDEEWFRQQVREVAMGQADETRRERAERIVREAHPESERKPGWEALKHFYKHEIDSCIRALDEAYEHAARIARQFIMERDALTAEEVAAAIRRVKDE